MKCDSEPHFTYYTVVQTLRLLVTHRIKLACKIKHDSNIGAAELLKRREKLANSINAWKDLRNEVLGPIHVNLVPTDFSKSCIDEPETWKLALPSSWGVDQRSEPGMAILVDAEVKLRKGALFDTIRFVRSAVKVIAVLRNDRNINARSTSARTRSATRIIECEQKLRIQITAYNHSRDALVSLAGPEYSCAFPMMSEEDTYRSPPAHMRRAIGASRKPGGRPWNNSVNAGAPIITTQSFIPVNNPSADESVRTGGNTAKSS